MISERTETPTGIDPEEQAALASIGMALEPVDPEGLTGEATHVFKAEGQIDRIAAAASFYLRRLRAVDAQHEQVNAILKREIEVLHEVYGTQMQKLDAEAKRIRDLLEDLRGMAAALGAFEKRKTMELAGGTWGQKATPERIVVVDADAVLAWAKQHLAAAVKVKVSESVPQPELAKHYKATGELPDGCDYKAAGVELVAKPREEPDRRPGWQARLLSETDGEEVGR